MDDWRDIDTVQCVQTDKRTKRRTKRWTDVENVGDHHGKKRERMKKILEVKCHRKNGLFCFILELKSCLE